MIRPWQIWSIFGIALLLACIALLEMSRTVLRLDKTEAEAQALARLEENVRLALWRMDSTLGQFFAQESVRPYFSYHTFFPAERAYTRMFAQIKAGEILVPSPLLMQHSPYVRLYFQITPDKEFTSPQVPTGNMRDLAETGYLTSEAIQHAEALLKEFEKKLPLDQLLQCLPCIEHREKIRHLIACDPTHSQELETESPLLYSQEQQEELSPVVSQQRQQHSLKNSKEWQVRSKTYQQNYQQVLAPEGLNRASELSDVNEGIFKTFWIGELLLLARRVSINHQEYFQGCWLNWENIQKELSSTLTDLLPSAQLLPLKSNLAENEERLLATLPVKLIPGALPLDPRTFKFSPIRLSLSVAWACLLIAIVALTAVLSKSIALSERRGAFVSAVTHELRTPLTTFQMYTEMLLEGFIVSPEKRTLYLKTLQNEALRLSHLVENVLAYARIEKGRAQGVPLPFKVAPFLRTLQERFQERATPVQMKVILEEISPEQLQAIGEASALEQILFNLVDNACKYGASEAVKEIRIQATSQGKQVWIRIQDQGRGISKKEAKKTLSTFF
jgi:signal transduction histidine kinase